MAIRRLAAVGKLPEERQSQTSSTTANPLSLLQKG
jgi:hypothetical protein